VTSRSSRATQGAESSGNDPCRPVEPEDHALGRSRGGLTTKIHGPADACADLVAVSITAGRRGDNPQLLPLLDRYPACDCITIGPLETRLLADKAYSHPSTRRELRKHRVKHTIPENATRSPDTRRKAPPVTAHPRSIRKSIRTATLLSAASAVSSNGET
jgi:putative transposase